MNKSNDSSFQSPFYGQQNNNKKSSGRNYFAKGNFVYFFTVNNIHPSHKKITFFFSYSAVIRSACRQNH